MLARSRSSPNVLTLSATTMRFHGLGYINSHREKRRGIQEKLEVSPRVIEVDTVQNPVLLDRQIHELEREGPDRGRRWAAQL